MKLNLKNPIVFFDLETTGTSINVDRIVEICYLKVHPNGNEEAKTLRINPEMHIPEGASAVHGIYDKDVADCPTFKEVARTIANDIEGCDLAGFNSNRFDIPVLAEEFLRAGVDIDLSRRKFVDVQVIFHKLEQRTLSAAYKFYCGKNLEDAHTAAADTQAADLDTWIHAFTKSTNTVTVESVNALYGEYSEATGTGMKFYTPKAPTPKKALHPDFTVESGTQENLIHAILHVRRILTLHEGLRWFDIKRYGLEIYRRTVYNNEITVNDELKADDSRRAIQLPQSVITAGLEANPRN